MTVLPTLEGGLRVDIEDPSDWELLRGIISDATCCNVDLASRLGGLMTKETGGEDWDELIVPDLREGFQDELAEVSALIESAIFNSENGPGPLWISPDDAYQWYSSLNQARLALEEVHHFGPEDDVDPLKMSLPQRAAFIRSGFYSEIQMLLLRYVMK